MKEPGTIAKIKAYAEAQKEGLDLSAPALIKFGARMLETTWAARVIMRLIAAASGSLTVWLVAHNAGEHVDPIVTGFVSAATFLTEIGISWLHKKAGLPEKIYDRPDASIVERLLDDEKLTPRADPPPVGVELNKAAEQAPSNAPGQRFAVPGALEREGFPTTEQLAAEVKRLLPPAPEERTVAFREQFSNAWQKRVCPNFQEARKFRDEMRAGGLIANILPK